MRIVDSRSTSGGRTPPARPWPPGRETDAQRPYPISKETLLLQMDQAGVERVVLVPPSWEGDRNDLALEAAATYPDRFGVMGRLSLTDPASRDHGCELARPAWHARHAFCLPQPALPPHAH